MRAPKKREAAKTVTTKVRKEESKDNEDKIDSLPEELQPAYDELLSGDKQQKNHDLVKAADKLSAYIKCIEERKAGNNEFLSAEKQIRQLLLDSHMPEVDYFMLHFIPAFEKNLDELGTIE